MKRTIFNRGLLFICIPVLVLIVAFQIASETGAAGNNHSLQSSERFRLNVARRGHTLTALADGRVVIIGGENANGALKEAEVLYSSSLEIVAQLQTARSRHTATLLSDGRVLVIGGTNQADALDSTELFDPRANSFTAGPRLNRARAGHSATVLADGRLLIAGGNADGSAELFDPATGLFTLLQGKLSVIRSFHGATLLKDGSVLLVGGIGDNGQPLETAELFDMDSLRFSSIAHWMLVSRVRPTLRVLSDGKVQVIGGDQQGTMQIYDPVEKFFRGIVPLTSIADILPAANLLSSQTRAVFLKNKKQPVWAAEEGGSKNILEWADYTAVELEGLNQAVIADGVDPESGLAQSVLRLPSSAAMLTTNKALYFPGESPVITGSGWEPGERIIIVRQDYASGKSSSLHAVADEHGNFTTAELTPKNHQRGVKFILTAMGQSSGYVAQTSYKDADPIKHESPQDRTIKIKIPLELSKPNGSLETEAGLLKWRVVSNGSFRSSMNSPSSPNVFSGNASFPTSPCLGNSQIGCGAMDVSFRSGVIEVEGAIDAALTFDAVGADTEVAPSLAFVEGVIVQGELQIAGNGTLKVAKANIGSPLVTLNLDLGQITGSLSIGVVAGLDIVSEEAVMLRIPFGFGQAAQMDAAGSAVTFTSLGTPLFNADVIAVSPGNVSAKVSIGPEASISLKNGDKDSGSASVLLNGFVMPKLRANSGSSSTCQNFNTTLDVGIQASANVAATGIATGTASKSLYSKQVVNRNTIFKDDLPPTITPPADISVSTFTGQCSATVQYSMPVVSDNCTGIADNSLSCSPSSGAVFPKGTTTVSCSVRDNFGNSASTEFKITVLDTERPVLTGCLDNIIRSTDADLCTAVVNYAMPQATDNCSVVTVSSTHPPGTTFPKGTTTVTITAADASGNQSTCSFTVTVEDKQAPVILCPSNITQSTDPGQCSAVVRFAPTATDNCPGVTVVSSISSGAVFQKGTTPVTVAATDAAGNQSTCTFNVTIVDRESPMIACPANIVQFTDRGQCSAVVSFSLPSATDNCPGVTVTSSISSGAVFQKGTTAVTLTATDAAGNKTTCSFTVSVVDNELPVLNSCPANITQSTDPGLCSAVVRFTLPTATDNCPGVAVSSSIPSGAVFQKGTTLVTVTATDVAGNKTACSFTVTVVDTELPVLACPANITQSTDPGLCSAVVRFAPMATDNCPGVTVATSIPSGTVFPKGVTTVTVTATDAVGNRVACSFTVMVVDTEMPVIGAAWPNPPILADPDGSMRNVTINYPVTDNCPGVLNNLSISSSEDAKGVPDPGTPPVGRDWEILSDHQVRLRAERKPNGNGRIYTITISSTDAAGNQAVKKTVTVKVPR